MNSKGQKPSIKPLIAQKQDDEIEIVPIEKPKIAKKAKVEAMDEETLDVTPAIVEDGTQEAIAAKKKKVDTHSETNERKGRIFLKNLVFDTNEKMLRKLCVKFGEICDVNIPVDPSTNRPRGFAFVEYVNKNSALKAITDLNKIKWKGREIEVGLSVDKRRYLPNGQPAPGDGAALQPITGEDLGGDIEVVKAGAKPSQATADEKTGVEAVEDEEMDELDKIVMQNIEDMGDEFEFDSEDEDQADEDNKDKEVKSQPKQGVTEIDMREVSKEDQSKIKKPEDLEKLLKDAENVKKKEIAKKQENEDLSKTCFVRGVSYDITEADFAKFIKQNIGDIHYVKLVAFKAAEGKHNGNGFVKFKEQKVADRLIDMTEQFNKGEYIPQAKDPKIEIHGIRVQFFPALKKNEAKEIKVEREKEIAQKGTKDEKKARTKKKFKSLDELIATDKTGKRRLVYTKLGFFDNIEDAKLNDVDKAQRSAHRDEKMAKIQNPNYFVSEKRVILKNIDKMLTDIQVRTLATEVMSAQLTPKEIKKSKIFSDVKLISSKTEESTGKSSVSVYDSRASHLSSLPSLSMQRHF